MPAWSGEKMCWRALTADSPKGPLRRACMPPSCGPSSRPWRRERPWRARDSGPLPAGDRPAVSAHAHDYKVPPFATHEEKGARGVDRGTGVGTCIQPGTDARQQSKSSNHNGALVSGEMDRASSMACLGLIRRTFRHAGIDPGHDLIDLSTGQKGPLQRHFPKATDATGQGPYQM